LWGHVICCKRERLASGCVQGIENVTDIETAVAVNNEKKMHYFQRNRLQAPYYLSRVDHCWNIRARMIRTDVGKFSFVNRRIAEWNQLPEGAIGTSPVKKHTFRKRVRKVKIR
jgi:hypothetical protein